MHLTPREKERLLLAAAADLARRRLARGAPLGATEAVALVCDEACELAWDGMPLEEVIVRARSVVPPGALLPGVPELVPVIEVEARFPWGSTLVHIDAPFGHGQEQEGPERARLTPAVSSAPGAVRPAGGVAELAPGAVRRLVLLRNTGPRDVWISSHFPLDQVNQAVEVLYGGQEGTAVVRDDALSPRCRLDLPAGEALLLRAGEQRAAAVVLLPGPTGEGRAR